jgi:imidazole glycerol-phosphate synthase subunit HisH
MPREVKVVDYGMGNVGSVLRALSACGAAPMLTSVPEEVAAAPTLVLPGVGAFGDGMEELRRRGLIEPICTFARSGRPLLGICLGMQMMLATGEEFGVVAGLGLIAGNVRALAGPRKIPHAGWNLLSPSCAEPDWQGTILDGSGPGDAVYFLHSYAAVPDNPAHRLADCDYDGCRFAAVIRHENIYGCQFHPEKSGPVGLRILRNFLKLSRP